MPIWRCSAPIKWKLRYYTQFINAHLNLLKIEKNKMKKKKKKKTYKIQGLVIKISEICIIYKPLPKSRTWLNHINTKI